MTAFDRLCLTGIAAEVCAGRRSAVDVAGLPTTAACPAFAYDPTETAPVVARLVAAGAVVLGKTSLDQFATGLGGWRAYIAARAPAA